CEGEIDKVGQRRGTGRQGGCARGYGDECSQLGPPIALAQDKFVSALLRQGDELLAWETIRPAPGYFWLISPPRSTVTKRCCPSGRLAARIALYLRGQPCRRERVGSSPTWMPPPSPITSAWPARETAGRPRGSSPFSNPI